MFDYDPKDGEEKGFTVLPSGDYEIEIKNVIEKVSKAGNDMLEVSICVYGADGITARVFDYIVNPSTIYKLKSICRCIGFEFEGTIDEELLIGKRMLANVSVRPPKDGYAERNEIKRYLSGMPDAKPAPTAPIEDLAVTPSDDSIPF